jgi:predicted phosphodiesterase
MPVHINSLSRRDFLASSTAAVLGSLAGPFALAADAARDDDRWVLLADTHISADRKQEHRGVTMAKNLAQVVVQVAALEPRPAGIVIDGDCAFGKGEPGEYATLGELLKPVVGSGTPVHLTLGNHDHRENIRKGMSSHLPERHILESKQVSIVRSRRANWFLLDTLHEVNASPGKIGDDQLAWLTRALDEYADRPALIVMHHNPIFQRDQATRALVDTDELFAVLKPRQQVKAVFFGHSHHWALSKHDGIHLVNLPPVAYVFVASDPSGWVDLKLADAGAMLKFHALDPNHKAHGRVQELAWR